MQSKIEQVERLCQIGANLLERYAENDQAEDLFRIALTLDPKCQDAYYYLVQKRINEYNDGNEDIELLNEVVSLNRQGLSFCKDGTAHLNMAQALRNLQEDDDKPTEEIIRHCRKAIQLDPELADEKLIIEMFELVKEKKPTKIKSAPTNQKWIEENIELAEQLFDAYVAAEITPESTANLDEATELLNDVLSSDPNNWEALNLIGTITYLLKDDESAAANWKSAYRLNPKDENVNYNMALMMEASENYTEEQFINQLKKAVKMNPEWATDAFVIEHLSEKEIIEVVKPKKSALPALAIAGIIGAGLSSLPIPETIKQAIKTSEA